MFNALILTNLFATKMEHRSNFQQNLFYFLDVPGIMEVVREESAKDPVYDCPHCDKIFPSFAEAEGHISIEHEDLTENVIKCAECKKDLPKDPTAIKHHMITEHMVQRTPEPVLVPKKEPVQLFLRYVNYIY